MHSRRLIIFFFFALAFITHAAFSVQSRQIRPSWTNVPPVPQENMAASFTLGDEQLAYRMIGIMLQNLGETGGRSIPLQNYDYTRLGQWFFLEDSLDSRSNYVPVLAAYYFGATPDPDQLDSVIDYLSAIGQRPYGQKWRWLAHAVYLSRFEQRDFDKAMRLAEKLADMYQPGMPGWSRQMPAFIAMQKGDKRAAYEIMMAILKDQSETMHPNEVNFMVSYICERLLDESEAAQHPLCNPER